MKTKVLISFAVTTKLVSAFVFAYANCWFSDVVAKISFSAFICEPHLQKTYILLAQKPICSMDNAISLLSKSEIFKCLCAQFWSYAIFVDSFLSLSWHTSNQNSMVQIFMNIKTICIKLSFKIKFIILEANL